MPEFRPVTSRDMLQEQVEQARKMTPEQKFRAGGQLFDASCRFALADIRERLPHASDAECLLRLKRRFEIADSRFPGFRP